VAFHSPGRWISFLLLLAAASACVSSRVSGGSFERVPTSALPAPAHVFVLEPPSYAARPDRRYPVLYFLHDIYGGGATLASHGVAAELAARMADGRLPEFFVERARRSGDRRSRAGATRVVLLEARLGRDRGVAWAAFFV
jgi:hypothetical protein